MVSVATKEKAAAIIVFLLLHEKKNRNRRVLVREWVARRQEKGAFRGILRGLEMEDRGRHC